MAVMAIDDGLDLLDRRARNASWIVWTFIGVAAGSTLGQVLEFAGVVDTNRDPLDALSTTFGLIYVAEIMLLLVSMVFVAMWIYRAHANLREADLDGLHFTPGWSIGWFFVPILNLWMPFQAMRELVNASLGKAPPYSAPTPSTVSAWWAAWLVGNFASNFDLRLSENVQGNAGALVGALGTAALAVSAKLLIDIIRNVTAGQRQSMRLAETFA
jgi:hypothetical protein